MLLHTLRVILCNEALKLGGGIETQRGHGCLDLARPLDPYRSWYLIIDVERVDTAGQGALFVIDVG